MAIAVHPTLDSMAVIYNLSTEGGADSVRFRSYVDLAGSGHRVHAYNPMTGNPAALKTVEQLRAMDAERIVGETLAGFDGLGDMETAVAVLTPGAWTDRLFTDVRNRRDGAGVVWFWAGEPVDPADIRKAAEAEAVRTMWRRAHGRPQHLLAFAGQEATVLTSTGFEAAHADEDVVEIFEIVGDQSDDHTLIAFLVGDEEAEAADWRGLGLSGDEGPRTVARWQVEQMSWREALKVGWVPIPTT
ncbi:MAG: hypothetical protein WAL25_03600 [Acidimicrobiia bacterium]